MKIRQYFENNWLVLKSQKRTTICYVRKCEKALSSPLNIVSQRDIIIDSIHLGDDDVWVRIQLRNRQGWLHQYNSKCKNQTVATKLCFNKLINCRALGKFRFKLISLIYKLLLCY